MTHSLRCLRVTAVTHLLRRADPGLLAYPFRRERSRSGSELRGIATEGILET
jgi:hypothetical protein